MKTKIKEGWLLIDNRLAPPEPGIPKFMEAGVLTCNHCQRQLIRNPERVRERAWCSNCDHYICDSCESVRQIEGCKTFEAKLDDQLRTIVSHQIQRIL